MAVQDVDRPDINGNPPKMLEVRNQIHQALQGLIPYLHVTTSDNICSAVIIVGSYQPKDQWINGILENSPYFKLLILPHKGQRYYNQGDDLTFDGYTTPEIKKPRLRAFTGNINKTIKRIKDWIVFNS